MGWGGGEIEGVRFDLRIPKLAITSGFPPWSLPLGRRILALSLKKPTPIWPISVSFFDFQRMVLRSLVTTVSRQNFV